MELKEIIAAIEKTLDVRLNEETIGKIIDDKLKAALAPISKNQLIVGALPDEMTRPKGVTFSQWLGDATRHMAGGNHPKLGQGLKWLKPEQLVPKMGDPQGITKDLYEGGTTTGGYLVPTEVSRQLIDVSTERFSVIPGLCRQIPMQSNQIVFPTLTSGLTGYWIPEAGSTSTLGLAVDGTHQAQGEKIRSNAAFGQMGIVAYVYAVIVVISNQLLDDSDPGIDLILRNLFAETLGAGWDNACLMGAGTALDPIGGLNTKITTNALQAGAQFDFDDILDLVYSCLDQDSVGMPIIVGNTKAERALLKTKDQNNQYLYKPPIAQGGVPTVWGHDYRRNGNIANTYGADANKTRLFAGDFSRHGYAGSRAGVTIIANPFAEPYFSYNQTAYRAEFRIGFNVDHEKYFAKMDGVPTT